MGCARQIADASRLFTALACVVVWPRRQTLRLTTLVYGLVGLAGEAVAAGSSADAKLAGILVAAMDAAASRRAAAA